MQSEIPKMLTLLKQQFKQSGVKYAEIAERLDISEITVKRYLAGKGLTVSILEKLCRAAGLHLSDLTELLSRDEEIRPRQLSLDQELSLSKDLKAAFVFYLLRSGWTGNDIAVEFDIDQVQLFSILRFLEKIGLIALMPQNKARLLTVRFPHWLPSGPVRRAIDRSMIHVFEAVRIGAQGSRHELETMKITPRGLTRIHQALDQFTKEVREIAASNRAEPGSPGEWYTVMSVAQSVDPRSYFQNGGQLVTTKVS